MSDEKPVDMGLTLAGTIYDVEQLIEDGRVSDAATRDLREAKQAIEQARRRIEQQNIANEVLEDGSGSVPGLGLNGEYRADEDGGRVTISQEDCDGFEQMERWVTSDIAIELEGIE